MKIVVATTNKGKLEEIAHFFNNTSVTFLTLRDVGLSPVDETGHTFLANARLKAQAAQQASGLWSLGEDSGLEVDALNGRPGIYSARFAGEDATDAANNEHLLREMARVDDGERNAGFRCAMVLVSPGGKIYAADGRCRGIILKEPRGEGGFGYDPLFYVPALDKTFAELTQEEKTLYSHRGMALRQLREVLDSQHILPYD